MGLCIAPFGQTKDLHKGDREEQKQSNPEKEEFQDCRQTGSDGNKVSVAVSPQVEHSLHRCFEQLI